METIADTIRHHPEFWYTHTGPHHHFHTHSHPPLHSTVLHTHSVFVHSRHVLTIASMSAIDGNHRRHHPTSPWILVHPHRPTSPLSHSDSSPSLASIETLKSHWCIWWVLLETSTGGGHNHGLHSAPHPEMCNWPSLACQQSMETIADTIRHHPEFWYTHTGPLVMSHTDSSPKAANLAYWGCWSPLMHMMSHRWGPSRHTPTPKCATDTDAPLSHTDLVTEPSFYWNAKVPLMHMMSPARKSTAGGHNHGLHSAPHQPKCATENLHWWTPVTHRSRHPRLLT